MKQVLVLLLAFGFSAVSIAQNTTTVLRCQSDADCPVNGACFFEERCICDKGFITPEQGPPCSYEQKSQLTAILLHTIVLGLFGAGELYAGQYAMGAGQLVLGMAALSSLTVFLLTLCFEEKGKYFFGKRNNMAMYGFVAAASVLAVADIAWWIFDFTRFIKNEVPDENGYPLFGFKTDDN